MRIDTALQFGTTALSDHSESARLDCEILLSHILKKQRSYLYAWPEVELDAKALIQFEDAIELRKTEHPVAYIIGYQEFWSLEISVTPDVLIPRPDTELLVETSLEKLQGIKSPKILELGTGSGAIALALASERRDSQVTATDLSPKALEVARSNQLALGLENISFFHSDWFKSIPQEHFHLIVSNPPYIDPVDPHLITGIRHEPESALIAENKGLADLALIIAGAKHYLTPTGWLLLEHGYDQGTSVPKLLKQAHFQQVHCLKDLSGNDRISIGQSV